MGPQTSQLFRGTTEEGDESRHLMGYRKMESLRPPDPSPQSNTEDVRPFLYLHT